jgi:hypothetical protein
MSTRAVSRVILCCLMMIGIFSPAHALTQEELVAKASVPSRCRASLCLPKTLSELLT